MYMRRRERKSSESTTVTRCPVGTSPSTSCHTRSWRLAGPRMLAPTIVDDVRQVVMGELHSQIGDIVSEVLQTEAPAIISEVLRTQDATIIRHSLREQMVGIVGEFLNV